jgi:hypothetical protein
LKGVDTVTQAQQRASALQAARYQLRRMKFDVYQASAHEAHQALDEYARLYPAMVPSQWYHGASDAQLDLFYKDWCSWQRKQRQVFGR